VNMLAEPFIRLIIIDDNALIRTATKMLLSTSKRFILLGEAGDGHTGIRMAKDLQPDVVLMDINMQPIDGIKTTRELLSRFPEMTVIGFSALPYPHQEKEMIDAGAVGVINKSSSRQDICNSIINFFEQKAFRNNP
jgi:DNA-binding NarL/FixJ family response regulator